MDNIGNGRADLIAWREAKPKNYFTTDTNFRKIIQMCFGRKFDSTQLEEVGELSASQMNLLAVQSNQDENLPRLNRYDSSGTRIEEVVFHPSYHKLGALVWNTGVLSVLSESGNNVLSGALAYLMAQNGEAGHLCPVACSAGAIKLIQQLGTSAQKDFYLPRLLDRDYSRRIHASQFLTEVQGGSDVGSNASVAERIAETPGAFRITGEKWFCSVVDAGLFIVTARLENSAAGTKGLSLFLVPRIVDAGVNEFFIRKLKYKLGTRSMATGEVEFQRALAEQIGPLEEGFKNVVSIVLDTSRIYNAVSACGLMRRAYMEAQTFASHRKAFGKRILEFPLVRRTLARMKLDASAAVATTFRILNMSDQNMSADLAAARRIHVNINKYWTALLSTKVVRDGIEVLGGNGTIEDFSVLPRLYRDAIVIESWEGTHNTLCLQVLRDFAQRGMHVAWIKEHDDSIGKIRHPFLSSHRERVKSLTAEVSSQIQKLLAAKEEEASLFVRFVVDRMCILAGYAGLLLEGEWELAQGEADEKMNLLEYYRLTYVDVADPSDSRLPVLEKDLSSQL